MLELVPDTSDLLPKEQYWLDRYNPSNRSLGYNIADQAEGGNWLGKKLPAEMCEKIGKAHLGMKRSAEACRNISESRKGWKPTEEHRQKISKKTLGMKRSTDPEKAAVRSAGIRAGWVTRRLNTDTSETARRGWETRRAKEQAALAA